MASQRHRHHGPSVGASGGEVLVKYTMRWGESAEEGTGRVLDWGMRERGACGRASTVEGDEESACNVRAATSLGGTDVDGW